jgi:hypothetical protein
VAVIRNCTIFLTPTQFAKSTQKGAQTSIYLATSAEVEGVSGKYFVNQKAKRSSGISYDEGSAQQLWRLSEDLTK